MKKIYLILSFFILTAAVQDCFAQCTPTKWYRDADGDQYGDPAVWVMSCSQPDGYVANAQDELSDNDPLHGRVGSYYFEEWYPEVYAVVTHYAACYTEDDLMDSITINGTADYVDIEVTLPDETVYQVFPTPGDIGYPFFPIIEMSMTFAVPPGSQVTCVFGRMTWHVGDAVDGGTIYTTEQDINLPPCGQFPSVYYNDTDNDGYGDPHVTATSYGVPPGYVTNSLDGNDGNPYLLGPVVNNCPGDMNLTCPNVANFTTPFAYDEGQTGDVTFHSSPVYQTWVVPDHVYSVNVDAAGFQGQGTGESLGGAPGRVQTMLAVTPGETLYIGLGNITTGGAGATNFINSDADDAHGFLTGGHGGDLAQVGRTGTLFGDTLIVAGGGGGGAASIFLFDLPEWNGGPGGYIAAVNPNPGDADFMHGLDGVHSDFGTESAGGGGGGYKGGGGVYFTGGGGGSSHVAAVGTSNALFTEGYTGTDGYVRITYTKQYDMTLTAGLSSGSAFPAGPTPVTFEYTNSSGETLSCAFTVTVDATLQTWYLDVDNDGYYVSSKDAYCKPGDGYTTTAIASGDCDDNDGTKWQSALLYIDADDDGFDHGTETVCYGDLIPAGYADFSFGSDCDDDHSAVNPFQTEVCNGVDDDCNGAVDDNAVDAFYYYADVDGDTYGDKNDPGTLFCTPPPHYSADNTDCDDNHASVFPGGTEVCNGLDDDCNGTVDDFPVDGLSWYADNDHDTYGDVNGIAIVACVQPKGFVADNTDCDDSYADINPGAVETCNGIDDNCNGLTDDEDSGVTGQSLWYVDVDQDGDGDINDLGTFSCNQIPGSAPQAHDCDDNNNAVYFGATEICNGIDDNCDSQVDEGCALRTYYKDVDGDGYGIATDSIQSADLTPPSGYADNKTDCNDGDQNVFQLAVLYIDGDGDGFDKGTEPVCYGDILPFGHSDFSLGRDCDDVHSTVHPGATEVCNGLDDDCNGLADNADPNTDPAGKSALYADRDEDTYGTGIALLACPGVGFATVSGDCDDANPAVHPGATEVCNGIDDNCNGLVDNADPGTSAASKSLFYVDSDQDTYGSSVTALACSGAGYTTVSGDCNDHDPAVHEPLQYYIDGDHDTYGSTATSMLCSATPPLGYSSNSFDCNDANSAMHPGATEVCNGIDDDCNGLSDNNDPNTSAASKSLLYVDADQDTYGRGVAILACPGSGTTSRNGDCDDTNQAVHPGATEVCNGIDDNCNGLADDADPNTSSASKSRFYIDNDHDTYGTGAGVLACAAPVGYAAVNGDCNDANAAVHPGATEVCNGIDDNCNGSIDEGVKLTFYRDADGDGFGSPSSTTQQACSAPSGYVANNTDCNDSKSAIHPGAAETCNGIDDNCNGQIDEGVKLTFYRDADKDSYGDASMSTQACSKPTGYVANNTDCNDNSAAIHPGATEVCNGLDDNCNGSIDEGVKLTFYRDADTDGYGNASVSTQACSKPAGYVSNNTDCNDNSAAIHPGATEVCGNGIDDNCNGTVDDGCSSGVCANAINLATINITATAATFTWSAAVDPVQWNVEYKSTSNGSKWISTLLPGSARSFTVTGLKVNQMYNWHIQAKCGKTWTDFTPALTFKTSSNSRLAYQELTENETGDFKLFPNPNNGNFEIEFASTMTNATIEIFNAIGQKVFMQTIIEEKAKMDISLGGLQQGIYLIRITSQNGVETKRFMVAK